MREKGKRPRAQKKLNFFTPRVMGVDLVEEEEDEEEVEEEERSSG